MDLLEFNEKILARTRDLTPVEPALKELFAQGKRDQLLHGTDAQGAPFAPLAQSTLRQRQGSGPPLSPQGDHSAIITGYTLRFTVGNGRLTISAGWPFLNWVKYHQTGTRKMPRRDPGGFRPQDVAAATKRVADWVMGRS